MKKLISSLLVFVLLFNFISANMLTAYAEGSEDTGEDTTIQKTMTGTEANPSNTAATDILEEGEVARTTGGTEKSSTSTESAGVTVLGTVLGVLALLIDILALSVDLIMGQLTFTTEYDSAGKDDFQFFFSIERTVFNRIPLFDINYFNIEDDATGKTYLVGTEGGEHTREIAVSSSINDIKKQVAYVYQITRIIAMVIGFLVLIYIGIRMALASTASEKADYKKMFVSWVESIVLLFVMVYIMTFIMNLGTMLTNIFFNMEQALLASGSTEVFETTIRWELLTGLFDMTGMELTIWSIMYWVLLFTQLKLFWLYMKRVLMTGFLIVISPLITITYALDKVGDGKAQSFFVWFKEFTVNVLIQPLHALIYMVFILTANELAKTAPLLALLFLMSMGTVERMVKVIFNLRGLVTLRGINKFMKKGEQ